MKNLYQLIQLDIGKKEFKQIKPKILSGNRRYYDEKIFNSIKKSTFSFKRSRNDNKWC